MPLCAGEKLGPYEVLSPLGAGGMGEVYKARDTRLDRVVAIKVAAREFGERFQREAQAIAALNHPHICTLHDVGPNYLVLEFIEGAAIKGPRPVGEALRLAIQIAEAVNHAHRHGVIHRDLKPGNILVTKSGVKVLDFGLAKLSHAGGLPGAGGAALAATVTQRDLTQPGTILGTPRYMAPEQVEGREADQRSDIFAFGLVLYEMITGCAAFEGETQASLAAAILTAEPKPVTSLQPHTPPALIHLIETCLAKDPDDRRQTMHDVLLELRWIAEGGSQAGVAKPVVEQRKRRERVSWAAAVVALLAALVLGVVHFSESVAPVYPVRFEQALPPGNNIVKSGDVPAMAPDGLSFAYTGVRSNANAKPMLWIRRLDTVQATALPGTEDSSLPFWSPDSRWVAYFAGGKLWKIEADGGPPRFLCDAPVIGGGSWNRTGLIILGMFNGGLQQVSANGGQPRPLKQLDAARNEVHQVFPHFLPDGRRFLYASLSREAGKSGTYAGSLDAREPRRLIDTVSNTNFVSPGFLLFGQGPALMAQPFDAGGLEVTGEAFTVVDPVGRSLESQGWPNGLYSSSSNGALVYRRDISRSATAQPVWYSRAGKRLGSAGEPRLYLQGALSPDEKRFAAQITDPKTASSEIWLLDLSSGILSPLTSDGIHKSTAVWSPDGREILFGSSKKGPVGLFRKRIGGGDEREVFVSSSENAFPAQWLKDGSFLFLGWDGNPLSRLAPGDGAKPETLLKMKYLLDGVRVSPDGRWVAYNTTESGRWEVYIAAFPSFTERRQVSDSGGAQGHWRKDGKELFYLSLEGNVMSVPIKPGATLDAGKPTVLFQTGVIIDARLDQYAVAGDGQRFLVLDSDDTETKPFIVVLNWQAAMKKPSAAR